MKLRKIFRVKTVDSIFIKSDMIETTASQEQKKYFVRNLSIFNDFFN